jgi:hypothetical protein
MLHDRDMLQALAADRRRRLVDGRPVFALSDAEIERSTRTAMKLADASKAQVATRTSPDLALPA